MPDKRRHRGRHPDDERLFAADRLAPLRAAVADAGWLLSRGYAEPSTIKIVGDRYGLTARQRLAVRRSTCPDAALVHRRATAASLGDVHGASLAVDGFNVLITVESALAGGVVLVGRDGCHRDLASIHGSYRKVAETVTAVRLIARQLCAAGMSRVVWYLDRPVSNSARLRTLMLELFEGMAPEGAAPGRWRIELVDSPDRELMAHDGPVATSDSVILDVCRCWVNLAADVTAAHVHDAWLVDLRSPNEDASS
jgi:hypothetical protein